VTSGCRPTSFSVPRPSANRCAVHVIRLNPTADA